MFRCRKLDDSSRKRNHHNYKGPLFAFDVRAGVEQREDWRYEGRKLAKNLLMVDLELFLILYSVSE